MRLLVVVMSLILSPLAIAEHADGPSQPRWDPAVTQAKTSLLEEYDQVIPKISSQRAVNDPGYLHQLEKDGEGQQGEVPHDPLTMLMSLDHKAREKAEAGQEKKTAHLVTFFNLLKKMEGNLKGMSATSREDMLALINEMYLKKQLTLAEVLQLVDAQLDAAKDVGKMDMVARVLNDSPRGLRKVYLAHLAANLEAKSLTMREFHQIANAQIQDATHRGKLRMLAESVNDSPLVMKQNYLTIVAANFERGRTEKGRITEAQVTSFVDFILQDATEKGVFKAGDEALRARYRQNLLRNLMPPMKK